MEISSKDLRGRGFMDSARSAQFLAALPGEAAQWLPVLERSANPDQAVLQASRLHEADPSIIDEAVLRGGDRLTRLIAVLGASAWWGDYLVARPECARGVWEEPGRPRDELLASVGADPDSALPCARDGANGDDLRLAYRRILLDIIADDATCDDPIAEVADVARRLADLADAALEAALALARRDVDPTGRVRFAVIAMGKAGGRELNYISDVDVMYVVEPTEGVDERDAVEIGSRLGAMLAQACSGAGAEQPLWTVDANLRPEGRNGVLVRTLDSFVAYWDKWAQTWEFQALLKARHCAGDAALGSSFEHVAARYVWSAAGREGFVDNARSMRRRVEEAIPHKEADREIKLGRGGLRDVEFTVQLLQLVHGRTDESLRLTSTVDAIGALSAGGYVARADAAELTDCYCFLRTVEHRAQMTRMRRTHLVPTSDDELRVMGRSIAPGRFQTADDLVTELTRVRGRVRELHEDMFYRPIVAATAGLSANAAALDDEGARARLRAIGYIDPNGALAHIASLTQGTSRRAKIQRHLLPVFISWLADGADPDMGLLNFRALSEQIGDSHWYLALLRDSGVAASRLCSMLPNSRWVADALSNRPEAIAWLDSDAELEPRSRERLRTEVASLVGRHADSDGAASRVRAVRSREMLRAALSDLLCHVGATGTALSDACDAALEGALLIAAREDRLTWGADRAEVGLIAMGRYGGRETSYASDADVMAVHRPCNGASEAEAQESATAIINRVRALMGSMTTQMSVSVDLDLRPEGRSGPISRTVASYEDYYAKWASAWERQALLRARPAAGPTDVTDALMGVIEAKCYATELSGDELKDIRLLKARMETERLPRGAEPARHVKLGPGGLTDVEWVVQLLQLAHGRENPSLRTPSTLVACERLVGAGIICEDDARILMDAWALASRIRAANVLATGRTSGAKLDSVPRVGRDLIPLARILGYRAGHEAQLEEDWMRAARKSRAVMDRLFWQ